MSSLTVNLLKRKPKERREQTLSDKRVHNLFENFSAKVDFPLNTSQFKRPEYFIGLSVVLLRKLLNFKEQR